jgi:hypothetical protein
MEGERVMGG